VDNIQLISHRGKGEDVHMAKATKGKATKVESNLINKTALIKQAAEVAETTQVMAGKVVDAFIEGIQSGIETAGKVKVAGLGTFETSERAARTARNPKTGEPVQVPAKTVVKFKLERGLKVVG
jgi:DNA-binding protein HU-beta